MEPALVLVVLLSSGEPDDPVAQALTRATRETLGEAAQVIVRHVTPMPGDDDAVALGASLHADALAEIGWSDARREGAVLHLHLASPARWIDREIRFAPSDASPEKGRTLGFAVASMLPEAPARTAVDDAPPPASVTPPAPAAAPAASPSAEPRAPGTPDAAEMPAASPRPPIGAIDASALVTGTGGTGAAFGGSVGASWYVSSHFALRAGASLRRMEIENTETGGTLFDGGLGVAWRSADPTRARPWALGVRAGALAMHQALSHFSRLERTSESQSRWLPGADLVVEGSWAFADGASLVLGGGGQVAFGATDVYVRGAPVATIFPFSVLAQLGIRARF
jgi:hypothetical protein